MYIGSLGLTSDEEASLRAQALRQTYLERAKEFEQAQTIKQNIYEQNIRQELAKKYAFEIAKQEISRKANKPVFPIGLIFIGSILFYFGLKKRH